MLPNGTLIGAIGMTNHTGQKKNIAWDSDKLHKFKNVTNKLDSSMTQIGVRQNISGLRLPDLDDEDFMVWMRISTLPKFKKLHRVVRGLDLNKGDVVTVTILNWFPVSSFHGKKHFVLSTIKWCGGRNKVIAWMFISAACICVGLAVVFSILLLLGSRKLADFNMFQWHNRPTSTALFSV